MKCEWEQRVIDATRSRSWNSPLRAHLQQCTLCTETELIAVSLQEEAQKTTRMISLPPAGMIWRRAQALRRERELQRVTRRPFLIVGALGAIYTAVFLLWGIFQLPQSVHRLFAASPMLTGDMAIVGVVMAAILAIVGSCVLVL